MTKLAAKHIGSLAKSCFAQEQTVSVMGNTSRGIFLKTAPKWVVFLSYEGYRGPLTVNLVGDVAPLRALPNGGKVDVSPAWIRFPEVGISIPLGEASPWTPPPPPPATSGGAVETRLRELARAAHLRADGAGLSGHLPHLLGDAAHAPSHPPGMDLSHIRQNLEEGDRSTIPQALTNLLGSGRGLTPSWDDFTIGLLLALNRWEHILQPEFDLDELNAEITRAAYAKTTTISANLIECAARGLADERLLSAVDYLLVGDYSHAQVLEHLLGWGSSSGVDALVGMVVALLAGI
ncbi:MAG: hypothetical protein MAG431_00618 [Chloroflexi bacterium]|nr:hypothetical protein [Chloroflexota bacterium]